jgi:phage terminase large subunit
MELLDKQKEALVYLRNNHPANMILYGGAAGGGKTRLGCIWQIQRRLKYAGTKSLIGRSKLDTLKKTTIASFFETTRLMGLQPHTHYNYNQQSNTITFYNDSQIVLADLAYKPSDPHYQDLGGLELTDAFIDEAAEVHERAITTVLSRIRYKLNEYSLVPKLLMTCNPSKGYLYNEFYHPHREGRLSPDKAFIQSLSADNYMLPSSYMGILNTLPEVDRKRLLLGDWDFDSSDDRLYSYSELLRCFRDKSDSLTDCYITADIARLGKDRTVICVWKGLHLERMDLHLHKRVNEIVDIIKRLMDEYQVKLSNVICDEDGIGGGAVDYLRCTGFVNGSKAFRPNYKNLKADCYFKLGDMIDKNEITFNSKYKDQITKELELVRRANVGSDGKLMVTDKETIAAKAGGLSPDIADSIMMRAYFEVNKRDGRYFVGGVAV